jgi:hypothetical protein
LKATKLNEEKQLLNSLVREYSELDVTNPNLSPFSRLLSQWSNVRIPTQHFIKLIKEGIENYKL